MSKPKEIPGAQSLRRSLAILRLLGDHHETGLGVTEVVALSGLERSTAHRMLACLADEHFAERDDRTRRYRLGLEAMRLGFASLKRAPLVANYQAIVQRIARISEDTVFLLARQGDYTVCLLRAEGSFPVKIFSTNVGDIRPVGIGVGGLAMLATAPDEEIERVYQRHAAAFEAAGLGRAALTRNVAKARRLGYVEMADTVTPGVAGIGAVIPHQGAAFAAVCPSRRSSRACTPRGAWNWASCSSRPWPPADHRPYSSCGNHMPMAGHVYSSTMARIWMPMNGIMPRKIWFSVTCGGATPFR